MTDAEDRGADDRLKALFAQDEPPARDPAFSTAVMEAVVRRRFIEDLALLSGVTLVGGAVLWALWPSLSPVVTSLSQGLAPVAACLTLAAIVVTLAGGRPGQVFGFERPPAFEHD
jgi:hypothetical protein